MLFFNSDIRYFSNLSNVSNITIQSNGGNGIVYILSYKDGKSKAALKIPKDKYSDNLLYEYIVGKSFINKHLSSGVFVKTYALLFIKTDDCSEFIAEHITPAELKARFNVITHTNLSLLNEMCNCNEGFGILTEYVDTKVSLEKYMQMGANPSDLLRILIKIYSVLIELYPNFIHNDLSPSNVLIYNGEPKIIDYGRCYFKTRSISSDKIYEKYVGLADCMDGIKNGSLNGFSGIWNINRKNAYSFMNKDCSSKHGQLTCQSCRDSRDLKLLYDINGMYDNRDGLKLFFERVRPSVGTTKIRINTEPSTLCKFEELDPDNIITIHQAVSELYQIRNTLLVEGSKGRKTRSRSRTRSPYYTRSKRGLFFRRNI
jgi:serine/threonine protein kinase